MWVRREDLYYPDVHEHDPNIERLASGSLGGKTESTARSFVVAPILHIGSMTCCRQLDTSNISASVGCSLRHTTPSRQISQGNRIARTANTQYLNIVLYSLLVVRTLDDVGEVDTFKYPGYYIVALLGIAKETAQKLHCTAARRLGIWI